MPNMARRFGMTRRERDRGGLLLFLERRARIKVVGTFVLTEVRGNPRVALLSIVAYSQVTPLRSRRVEFSPC